MDRSFVITQVLGFVIHFSIAYFNGLLVRHKGVKVNYTRKINHFMLFFLPIYLSMYLTYERTLASTILAMCLMAATLVIYIKPVRQRVPAIATAFLSFDRPEDRPHTLLWLSTQILAATVIMIPLMIYFSKVGMLELIYIPLLINGFGDGLAEPVGVRFGRHPYKTWALFTRKRYIRTLEGSAFVLLVSSATILLFRDSFTPVQFIIAMAAVPVLMTLAEALSPHTWDTPFLYTVSGISLSGILMI
ncbi:hypothetical protein [Desulfoluna spongiiphila]|uniref:hypothetical protein n=1 Tax=Desulfoluna spongiiphila TaxID=419481 RepID=UPI0012582A42|nr:hypothetical protein [Desulfoluna spongiiphila]VVS94257.1 hypothetical protein DBB_38290 [Desulfoluna spongiiphila]